MASRTVGLEHWSESATGRPQAALTGADTVGQQWGEGLTGERKDTGGLGQTHLLRSFAKESSRKRSNSWGEAGSEAQEGGKVRERCTNTVL